MTILTSWSGVDIDITSPQTSDIHIKDIAHSLSMICRYNGTTRYHYSVAQHCVAVANVAQKMGCPPEQVLYALLHDATEAYICDIPRPLKTLLSDYNKIEQTLNRVIMDKFGISGVDTTTVDIIDYNIVYDEVLDVLDKTPSWLSQYESVTKDRTLFRKMNPNDAYTNFMSKYYELREVINA